MDERKRLSSQANLLISTRCFWVTLLLFGNLARAMVLNLSLKLWKNERMENKWAWKKCIADEGTTHPLQRHP
jgi:hypothetical protein